MTFVLRDLELSVRGDGYIVIPRECIGKIILKNVDIHYGGVEDDFALRQANADYNKSHGQNLSIWSIVPHFR